MVSDLESKREMLVKEISLTTKKVMYVLLYNVKNKKKKITHTTNFV